MSDESGFADVSDDVVGGEGDAAAPTAQQFERSPLKVLASLEDAPLEQAMKCIEYIKSGRERERRFLRAVSPTALNLIAQNGKGFKEAVESLA